MMLPLLVRAAAGIAILYPVKIVAFTETFRVIERGDLSFDDLEKRVPWLAES